MLSSSVLDRRRITALLLPPILGIIPSKVTAQGDRNLTPISSPTLTQISTSSYTEVSSGSTTAIPSSWSLEFLSRFPEPTSLSNDNNREDNSHSPSSHITSIRPIQLPPGHENYPKYTPEEEASNNLLNLYFLLIAVGVIIILIIFWAYRSRRKTKQVRSAERGQNALRRDLELGGWRIGMGGLGRWGGPAGGRSVEAQREEGLDERGEAPPPYTREETEPLPSQPARQAALGFVGGGAGGMGSEPTVPATGLASADSTYMRFPMPHLPPRVHTSTSAIGTGTPRLPRYDDIANGPPPAAPPQTSLNISSRLPLSSITQAEITASINREPDFSPVRPPIPSSEAAPSPAISPHPPQQDPQDQSR